MTNIGETQASSTLLPLKRKTHGNPLKNYTYSVLTVEKSKFNCWVKAQTPKPYIIAILANIGVGRAEI